MTKAYAVVRRGYEYNDEIYQAPGNDGVGTPLTVFKTKKEADEQCFKLTKKAFESGDIDGYTYNRDELEAAIEELGTENFDDTTMKKGLSDEKVKEIIERLDEFYSPYFVIEVESC